MYLLNLASLNIALGWDATNKERLQISVVQYAQT